MAARAYVDGFNLYHSLLRGEPSLKWLDLTRLWGVLLPGTEVERTYYFTARVHAMPLDKGAPARQQRLLDALDSVGVEIVLGRFRQDRVMARPTSGSLRDRIEVHRTREKASDVNLASSQPSAARRRGSSSSKPSSTLSRGHTSTRSSARAASSLWKS